MYHRVCFVALCFIMVRLAEPVSAIYGCDSECLSNKLDNLEEILLRMEDRMMTREQLLQDKLNVVENMVNSTRENLRNEVKALKIVIGTNSEQQKSMLESIIGGLNMAIKLINKLVDSSNNLITPSTQRIRSCLAESTKQSGEYLIQLGHNKPPFEAYCEQTDFGGGWIVIQQRSNGNEDFFRNWTDYREGFGNFDDEFWLGLERVHLLTSSRPHELILEVQDADGNYGYARYDEFQITGEDEQYALVKLGTYNGTAGDALTYNKGYRFSTVDRDNDGKSGGNCAEERQGAWWYYKCSYANLNGRYQNATNDWSSMSWYYFKNDYRGLVYSRMMIREVIEE